MAARKKYHWLRRKRIEKGLSITELHRLAGVSRSLISSIENKTNTNYKPESIQKIGQALGLPADEIRELEKK